MVSKLRWHIKERATQEHSSRRSIYKIEASSLEVSITSISRRVYNPSFIKEVYKARRRALYKGTLKEEQIEAMLALWHRFGAMTQVLSLMATHSDDRSQFRLLEWRKKRYTQVPLNQVAYSLGLADQKARMCIHALSRKERRVHVGEFGFGPWYLDHGILTHGIDPRYLVRSIDPRYLVQGFESKWFWTMVLSKT